MAVAVDCCCDCDVAGGVKVTDPVTVCTPELEKTKWGKKM